MVWLHPDPSVRGRPMAWLLKLVPRAAWMYTTYIYAARFI